MLNNNVAASVIGLGKLGLPTMTFFASRGYHVVGTDTDPVLIDELKHGVIRSEEPGLASLYGAFKNKILIVDSIERAVLASKITFVIVPTPSLNTGIFSTAAVKAAAVEIGKALAKKNEWHLAVLVSTVMPGATEESFVKTIEEYSGKKCGNDADGTGGFGVCYNPEFIALGSIIENLSHPDFILIGQSDALAGFQLASFYEGMFGKVMACRQMGLRNAELTKIGINTAVTMKISMANDFAEFCERMDGLDAAVVLEAMGLDDRIGPKYLKPGLGYGGPCFPRDTLALEAFARNVGTHARLARATDAINRDQVKRLVSRMYCRCRDIGIKARNISVLGLSYKIDTDVIERSQGVEIAEYLLRSWSAGFQEPHVTVHDRPNTLSRAENVLGNKYNVTYAENIQTALVGADVIIIAVADPAFIPGIGAFDCEGEKTLLVDPWRLMGKTPLPENMEYLTVGK